MTTDLKQMWAAGKPAFGGWCTSGSAFTAEVMAAEGFDFVGLDVQHGLYGYESVLSAIRAVNTTSAASVVRVPSLDLAFAGKILDAGAHGIIFPMVETADDAAAAVKACRYYPQGARSFGPVRAGILFGRDPEVLAQLAVCIVMIETARAVDNIQQIVSVDGVDAVFIGPGDLAITYGMPVAPAPVTGVHADAIEAVRQAASKAGLAVGMSCPNAEAALGLTAAGYTFLPIGADTHWVTATARAQVAAVRGAGY
ncbi:MAG TPA: aldolase/citrate lyase family protein [Mycobacterium sp.]|jgi:4-hydroxy-2-oxoheptanedioate aldolase|nr:aldolase/citrate lyase family protein [Mycobacterium sp.]